MLNQRRVSSILSAPKQLAGVLLPGSCRKVRYFNAMRLLLPLAFVTSLCSGGITWQTNPARRLAVGLYRYDIVLQTQYEHDDDVDNTYFVVTRANSRVQLCSAIRRSITRQGVVRSTGEYAINGSYLRFKERYYGPRRVRQWVFPDSVVKTFSSARTGQLHLIDYWEYTEGKGKKRAF